MFETVTQRLARRSKLSLSPTTDYLGILSGEGFDNAN